MRDFKKYKVWSSSMELCSRVYEMVNSLPDEEKYGLKSQISRAAVSIPSNIAEGSGRSSDKEFKRFLEIAIGSSFELETQLILCQKLHLIPAEKFDSIIDDLHVVQASLNSLISKLK